VVMLIDLQSLYWVERHWMWNAGAKLLYGMHCFGLGWLPPGKPAALAVAQASSLGQRGFMALMREARHNNRRLRSGISIFSNLKHITSAAQPET